MALADCTLFEKRDKVELGIARLQEYEKKALEMNPDGYYLAFSGGKDSVCIKHLADLAGVKYTAHYNFVGIDPPPLVKFIRQHHPDVEFVRAEKSFFGFFMDKQFPPTRQIRWCCALLKEDDGVGVVVTGIRWAESPNRAKRQMLEPCTKDEFKLYLHPIIDWTNADVWEFIHKENIPYCDLYDKGRTRLGCLMCPLSPERQRIQDAKDFPQYERAFRRIFKRLWNYRVKDGRPFDKWKDSDAMFDWWLKEGRKKKEDADQQCFKFDN